MEMPSGKEAHLPARGAQRRLEARIGQLLDEPEHSGDRSQEQVVHDQLEKRERFDFRVLARAPNGSCELTTDEWRQSRRALVALIRDLTKEDEDAMFSAELENRLNVPSSNETHPNLMYCDAVNDGQQFWNRDMAEQKNNMWWLFVLVFCQCTIATSACFSSDLNLFDDFQDAESSPEYSIFSDGDPNTKSRNEVPLNNVVGEWLKQDKNKMSAEFETKKQEMETYCAVDSKIELAFTIQHRCNEEKERNGYSCADQKKSWERANRIKAKQIAAEKKLKQEKKRLICDSVDGSWAIQSAAIEARLKQIDAEIQSEKVAAELALSGVASFAEKEELSAYAKKRLRDLEIENQKQREKEEAERRKADFLREQKEKQKKSCLETYAKTGVRNCGCGPYLPPISPSNDGTTATCTM